MLPFARRAFKIIGLKLKLQKRHENSSQASYISEIKKIYEQLPKKSLKILLSTQKYCCFMQSPDINLK